MLINFRLTEALKGGGIEKSLKELGLDDGDGSSGELTAAEVNSPNEYGEDPGCQKIEDDFREANKSLEAALPGNKVYGPKLISQIYIYVLSLVSLIFIGGIFGDINTFEAGNAVEILNGVNNEYEKIYNLQ